MIEKSLSDNGTLDTCVECFCTECEHTWEETFDGEYAADFRDSDTGEMVDLDGMLEDEEFVCPNCGSYGNEDFVPDTVRSYASYGGVE